MLCLSEKTSQLRGLLVFLIMFFYKVFSLFCCNKLFDVPQEEESDVQSGATEPMEFYGVAGDGKYEFKRNTVEEVSYVME